MNGSVLGGRHRIFWQINISFVALMLGLAVWQLPAGIHLEGPSLDARFRVLRAIGPIPVEDHLRLVGIDESTFEAFEEPSALWYGRLGLLLQALAEAQVRGVAVDVGAPERSFARYVPDADRQLMRGLLLLRKADVPVILGESVDANGSVRPIFRKLRLIARDEGIGLMLFPIDRDGVARRFSEELGSNGARVPTLGGQLARGLGLSPRSGLVQFAAGDRYDYVSLQQVLDWYAQKDIQRLKTHFSGKIVFLGPLLPWEDRHRQPVSLAGWERHTGPAPGVLLHLQTIRSLLGPGLIGPVPGSVQLALVLLAALTGLASWGARPAGLCLFLGAGVVAAASTWLLRSGLYLQLAPVLIALITGVVGQQGYAALRKLGERRRLRAIFGSYVSPGVMTDILSGALSPELGGVHRHVCLLFSDVRGFTSRSESMPATAVTTLLNRYFEEMAGAIHAHDGTLDKFMGDGIMAFFGAPGNMPNPEQAAFRTAREMLERLARLNRQLAIENIEPIRIGIGLHAGEAVVGHVGSRDRHEYTAIGDVVNVTARVEALTKSLGYPVVCSETVRDALGDAVQLTELGEQEIRGRAPLQLYGWRPEINDKEAK